jgi:hypothetical protein
MTGLQRKWHYRQVAQIDSFHLREERLRERIGRLCCSPVLAVGEMLTALKEAVGSLCCCSELPHSCSMDRQDLPPRGCCYIT